MAGCIWISHTRFCFTSGCMCFHSSQLTLENDIYLVSNLNQRTIFWDHFCGNWAVKLFLLAIWYHNALTPKICKITSSFSATQISYPRGAEANLKKLSMSSSRILWSESKELTLSICNGNRNLQLPSIFRTAHFLIQTVYSSFLFSKKKLFQSLCDLLLKQKYNWYQC